MFNSFCSYWMLRNRIAKTNNSNIRKQLNHIKQFIVQTLKTKNLKEEKKHTYISLFHTILHSIRMHIDSCWTILQCNWYRFYFDCLPILTAFFADHFSPNLFKFNGKPKMSEWKRSKWEEKGDVTSQSHLSIGTAGAK